MTQTLQPGQHPDADQLSAFAEHALPPHEQQQMFAHLATCADCRALVFLAQEAVPAAIVEPQPIPAHKPWFALFSGWKLALPTAAALACLILVTLHLRNGAVPNRQVPVAKTAQLEQTPPPLPLTPPPAQPAPLKSAPAELPQPPAIVPRSVNSPVATTTLDTGSPREELQAQKPRGALAGLGGAAATSADELKTATASRQSSLGMVSAGDFAAANLAPAAAPPVPGSLSGPLPVSRSPQAAGLASDSLSDQPAAAATSPRPAPSAPMLRSLNQQYSAVPPLPPPPQAQTAPAAAAPAATTETVNVSAAPVPLETESNATAEVVTGAGFGSLQAKARAAKKQEAALPSRLPVLSTIANARQQLALDTAGALFRSQDAGVTWQSVPVQWTGRATKIALAPSPTPSALAKDSISTAAAAPAKSSPAIFQLTTDAGQLWTSPDGLQWKRQ